MHFLIFLENRIWHFIQIIFIGEIVYEMSNLFLEKNKKK